jgi:hypothetical protein
VLANGFISSRELRGAMLELLTFLGSSARGAIVEPKLYGPFRLIEAIQRVINIMHRLGISDADLNDLADRFINEAMQISIDEAYCAKFADDITAIFATKLRDT